ncbi:MAG: metallophosphoesterase family protein [Bacteroidia bacterium]|nr:metallophosphoesterase family protein [Bacteroidia bacterium]
MSRLITLFLTVFFSTAYAQEILVPPYLQPGNSPNLRKEGKVIIWQTDSIPGNYKVECSQVSAASAKPIVAKANSVKLRLSNKTTFLYRANLSGLDFDATYSYQVGLNGNTIYKGSFETRTKKPKTRFAVFGDCGVGSPEQAKVAYQIFQQKPQFALLTGDLVYSYGRELEYRKRFFPYYLAPEAIPEKGAPLMNSIPFYMMAGNHDVYSADFTKYPDGLAYFYYSDLPLNAPIPTATVEAIGDTETVKVFKKNTSPRFPRITNYSFDYGNVHVAVLDANSYVNPVDHALVNWLMNDMRLSKADWKILAYHQPAFNSSLRHYDYQIMRVLAPITEKLGIDLVLTGHVHSYQRTVPLRFSPEMGATDNRYTIAENGRVNGEFKLDTLFNGKSNTKADGIIYVTTGAGGAALYDTEISEKPELWKKGPPENWAPYTAKLVSDRHSFTMIETDGAKLTLKQMDVDGKVFDEIAITK